MKKTLFLTALLGLTALSASAYNCYNIVGDATVDEDFITNTTYNYMSETAQTWGDKATMDTTTQTVTIAGPSEVGSAYGDGQLTVSEDWTLQSTNALFIGGSGVNDATEAGSGSVTLEKGAQIIVGTGTTSSGGSHIDVGTSKLACSGSLTMEEGSSITVAQLVIGNQAGTGTVTVKSGAEIKFDTTKTGSQKDIIVGGAYGCSASYAPTGTLTLEAGSILNTMENGMNLWVAAGGAGTGTVNVESSDVQLGCAIIGNSKGIVNVNVGKGNTSTIALGYVCKNSELNVTSGTLITGTEGDPNDADAQSGLFTDSTGAITVDGDSAAIKLIGGCIYVGAEGSLTAKNGGTVSGYICADEDSTVTLSSGHLIGSMDMTNATLTTDTDSSWKVTDFSSLSGTAFTMGSTELCFSESASDSKAWVTLDSAQTNTTGSWTADFATQAAFDALVNGSVYEAFSGADLTSAFAVEGQQARATANTWHAYAEDGNTFLKLVKIEGTEGASVVNKAGTEIIEVKTPEGKENTVVANAENPTVGPADLYINAHTTASTNTEATGQQGLLMVKVTTAEEQTHEVHVNNAYISHTLVLENTDLKAQGKVVAEDATVHLTQSELSGDETGTVLNSMLKGTGTIQNLSISGSSVIAGNSPGLLTLSKVAAENVDLAIYMGDELFEQITSSSVVDIKLGTNGGEYNGTAVTSGYVLDANDTLTGNVTIGLYSSEDTPLGLTFDAGKLIYLFEEGSVVQIFDVNGADLSGANFTLTEDWNKLIDRTISTDANGWTSQLAWNTDNLATDGTVSVKTVVTTPEPATATLSLLALAGLCARRRRR